MELFEQKMKNKHWSSMLLENDDFLKKVCCYEGGGHASFIVKCLCTIAHSDVIVTA